MPEPHFYAGAYARTFPGSRDARNLPLGEVKPGDIRDLDEPLDDDWLPVAGNEDHPLRQDRDGGAEDESDGEDPRADEGGAGETASPAGPPPAATPPVTGPQPAPPAVITATTQEG